jgi:starch synthase
MEKLRVLYVSQEITPFLPDSDVAQTARKLAQGMNEEGREIRAFMPRFGCINERRHQLHEVIRLSGLNLIINDTDHPLIIKVASVPAARMQVYFIDNEQFFKRKATVCDDKQVFFNDNDERSMFFVRGVLETIKKLGWVPNVIHCHGWMTALMPLYLKKMYGNDAHFSDAKVVYTPYGKAFPGEWDKQVTRKLEMDGFDTSDISLLSTPTYDNLTKLAVQFSDAVSFEPSAINADVRKFIASSDKPVLEWNDPSALVKEHSVFYDSIVEESIAV